MVRDGRRRARRHRRPEGDQGRLPGRQPVRQLDPLRQGQGADPAGRARQGPRHRGAVQPQLRRRRLAVLDSDRRLARRRSTGTASWATHRSGRSTRSGSSAGGTTGTTARPSPATCSSTCSPASTTPPARSGRRGSPPWAAGATGTTAATSTTSSWACSTTPRPTAHGSFTLSLVTDFEDGGGGATVVPLRRHRGSHRRQLQRAHPHPPGHRAGLGRPGLEGLQLGQDVLERPAKGVRREIPGRRIPPTRREAPREVDREIRRSQGLRRAVRPLRELLQRRSARASRCTKTRPSATAPPPRPCSATRATARNERSTGIPSP